MRTRHRQAMRFQLAFELLRIVQKAAKSFDLFVAEPGEQFELRLQGFKRAGGVELKRKAFKRCHGYSLSIRRLQSAPGSGVKQVEFLGRKPQRDRSAGDDLR